MYNDFGGETSSFRSILPPFQGPAMKFIREISNEHGRVTVHSHTISGETEFVVRAHVKVDPKKLFTDVTYETPSSVDAFWAMYGLAEDLYRIARGERASYACFGQGIGNGTL